jgi:hypothetical protein
MIGWTAPLHTCEVSERYISMGVLTRLLQFARIVVTGALRELRAHRRTTFLAILAATIGFVAVLPVTSLMVLAPDGLSSTLSLAPWKGGDLGMRWSSLLSWSPAVTHRTELLTLFRLLVDVAIGEAAVVWLLIVSIFATRESARQSDSVIQRAVGASKRHLLGTALLVASAIGATAFVLGGMLATASVRFAASSWPGTGSATINLASAFALTSVSSAIFIGELFPLFLPKRKSLVPAPSGKPLELFVPALQMGLSLAVMTAAALFGRQAEHLTATNQVTTDDREILQVTVPDTGEVARASRYSSLIDQVVPRTGLDGVSLSSPGAFVGLGMVDETLILCEECLISLQAVQGVHYLVSGGTFRALGLSIIEGRGIRDSDIWGSRRVVVVNRYLAENHLGPGAIGRQILIGRPREWYTVVGVVEDQPLRGFGAALQPRNAIYLSILQHPSPSVDITMNGKQDSVTLSILKALASQGSAHVQPVVESQLVAGEVAPLRWFQVMFSTGGWVIFLVGTLGTWLIIELWVDSARFELGVRRAFGARWQDVVAFVLARCLGVWIAGLAIGLWFGMILWGALAETGLPPWDIGEASRISLLLLAATLVGGIRAAIVVARTSPSSLLATA